MEMTKRVLGDEHPDTLTSMANLAATYTVVTEIGFRFLDFSYSARTAAGKSLY
jgi:hypothetical protein